MSEPTADQLLLVAELRESHERDVCEGRAWVAAATDDQIAFVWEAIQGLGGPRATALEQVIARFAQVGFEHLVLSTLAPEEEP